MSSGFPGLRGGRGALDAGTTPPQSRPMDDEDATPAAVLDLRGLKCPLPALLTGKALRGLGPGRVLEILCTDPLAGLDIPNLARETGDALLAAGRDGDGWRFTIRKA